MLFAFKFHIFITATSLLVVLTNQSLVPFFYTPSIKMDIKSAVKSII